MRDTTTDATLGRVFHREKQAACRIRVRAVEYFMHVTPEFPDDIAMVGLPAHVFKRAFVSPPPLFDGLLLIIPPI